MGIGKSTFTAILSNQCAQVSGVDTDLSLVEIIEADDLESPRKFAARINQKLSGSQPTVALGRPSTIDQAASSLVASPRAIVTMLPFRTNTPLFGKCLDLVSRRLGLDNGQRATLGQVAEKLQPFMQTPFYYLEIGRAIAANTGGPARYAASSALELFELALGSRRLRASTVDDLLIAASTIRADQTTVRVATIQGLADGGRFIHDGYRHIILALGVLSGRLPLLDLVRAPNSEPAFRLLLAHLEVKVSLQAVEERTRRLAATLEGFVRDIQGLETVPYIIFLQALAAPILDRGAAETTGNVAVVQDRCLQLVTDLAAEATTGAIQSQPSLLSRLAAPSLWLDVSDALSIVGDRRLMEARKAEYGPDSRYFTFVKEQRIEIGANGAVPRVDLAKPVRPFNQQVVTVGPLWVGKFLVTTEQFREFGQDPDQAYYFEATGAQWFDRDPELTARIREAFELSASRNFWKELREQPLTRDINSLAGSRSIVDVARARALNDKRIELWDEDVSDSRFSGDGKPVVGVNWWEALAFCKWWEERYISQFPSGSTANLLTDWEWEAIRRIYYDDLATPHARALVSMRTFPAHLRPEKLQLSRRAERLMRSSLLQPLHVGLFPVPAGDGPYDLIGNTWEWTRSRVYGSIIAATEVDDTFGPTAWDDSMNDLESMALTADRDVTNVTGDLGYRGTRGASFFSRDPNAAWQAAYRLCDPPFASYFDLGFRVAVHAPRTLE